MWVWVDDPGDIRDVAVKILPLAMSRETALQYTGLSKRFFAQAEREQKIRGRPVGRKGAMMFQTADLQKLVQSVFGDPEAGLDWEFA